MSLLQTISEFFQSLFSGSSSDTKKRQEVRKLENELKEIRPVIYKNELIQPNFAEAIRLLYINSKPVGELLSNTICSDDLTRNNRFVEQLLLSGFSMETQESIESFCYEDQTKAAMASDSLAYYFDKKHKELENVVKQLNTPEFMKIDNAINSLKQLSDICNFNYISLLRLFDVNFESLNPDYKPNFQPIPATLLETSLLDLYYVIADFQITSTTAKALCALQELYRHSAITDKDKDILTAYLGKIQNIMNRILTSDILMKLLRIAKNSVDFMPRRATYHLNSRQHYAEYLQGKFVANENRLKIEIKDITINGELRELFGEKPLLSLKGYNEQTDNLLRQNTTFSLNWIIPAKVIKTFMSVFYGEKVKSLLNDIVIEGFFNNPQYKSDFSSAVYACNDCEEKLADFENAFARGGEFDEALISGLIKDSHKDSDFVSKLKELVDGSNARAKQFIQQVSSNFYDLYSKIDEILADSKKPTSDTISNLKVLMGSTRNKDGSSLLEQQFPGWKNFLEIMKNYAIIGSIEIKS